MNKASIVPVIIALSLAACSGNSGEAFPRPSFKAAKAPNPVKSGPTPEELTAGMIEAVSVDNTAAAPVSLKFDIPKRPTMGQPVEVVLALLPQAAGNLSLKASGPAGLEVPPDAASIEIPAVEPTQAYKVTIAATPASEGVMVMQFRVSLTHDDIVESRSFSLPLIVATAGPTVAVTKR